MLPNKREILFVDDDQFILDALRAALYRQRKNWNMRFALGGEEALQLIDERSIDAIVTDMRMPGMTGTELLQKVRVVAPEAVRIMMSGQAEESLAIEAIPFTHQWLSKPTKSSRLVQVINRALVTRDLVHAGPARRALGSLNRLPIFPATYRELSLALSEPEPSSIKVGNLIAENPSLSARVLQMANSAFFGLPRVLTDIREAVGYLGFDTISQLLFIAEVIERMDNVPTSFDLGAFQRKSLATSKLAAFLLEGNPLKHAACAGGLLHGIGDLVVAFANIDASDLGQRGCVTNAANAEQPGPEQQPTTAAEVGGALLGIWGLPSAIVEAVAHHRKPSRVEVEKLDALVAVHIAQALISHALLKEQSLMGGEPETIEGLDTELLQSLGLEGKLGAWCLQADGMLEATPYQSAA